MSEKKKQTEEELLNEVTTSEYKYGFISNIKEDRIPNGLNKNIIKTISRIKDEPKWLLDWRLKAFSHWEKMEEPQWSNLKYNKIDFGHFSIIFILSYN